MRSNAIRSLIASPSLTSLFQKTQAYAAISSQVYTMSLSYASLLSKVHKDECDLRTLQHRLGFHNKTGIQSWLHGCEVDPFLTEFILSYHGRRKTATVPSLDEIMRHINRKPGARAAFPIRVLGNPKKRDWTSLEHTLRFIAMVFIHKGEDKKGSFKYTNIADAVAKIYAVLLYLTQRWKRTGLVLEFMKENCPDFSTIMASSWTVRYDSLLLEVDVGLGGKYNRYRSG